MGTTENNLHVPDDLLAEARVLAEMQGRTADELAVDALKRYLAHERLASLARYGQERARSLGLNESDVERLIAESRREQRGR